MNTIKILQLNAWTGRIKGAIQEFIKENDFDIICLQEAIWADDEDVLQYFAATVNQLKEESGLPYESRSTNWEIMSNNTKISQGNVVLSRFKIEKERSEYVYGELALAKTAKDLADHCYTVQILKLENGLNIVNHHGYWLPTPVGDETTVEVNEKVARLIKELSGPIVMCGDLNIIYESPAMRPFDFLTDLTHEYQINNTLVGLKFNGKVACDHILISDQIKATDFHVSDRIISDHKPLIATLEF